MSEGTFAAGSREHLCLVAQIYLRAVANGHAPAPVVAKHFSRPVPTVHGWIAKARRQGLLPPTRKGLASGDGGLASVLAADIGISEVRLLAALHKHRIRLGVRPQVAQSAGTSVTLL